MSYFPLTIPPGVFRNGTEYQSRGRWYDASMVRWENGEMKPIGGWQQFGDAILPGKGRGMLTWRDNVIGVWAAVGTVGSNITGTAQYGSTSTIRLASTASSVNDAYLNNIITITGGTGAGQYRRILSYNGSTKDAVISTGDTNWDTNPDFTSTYAIRGTGLFVFDGFDETLKDITPSSLQEQDPDASALGYGYGLYGRNDYGTERSNTTTYNYAPTWSLDTWGQYLVGCLYPDGRIYEWQLDPNTPAAVISNAPTGCVGLVVTQERFIFALGADGNSRQIRWCDQGDNTTWTPTATNQAGNKIIESGGPLMQGVKTRGQTMIFTTTDIYTATYIGAPLVYSFDRVGSANGIVSRRAAVASDSFVAWMGPRGFWIFDGYVREIPCEVEDYVFGDFNYDQQSKVHGWINSQYNEVWWHYPSADSDECDRYVTWNFSENHWSVGEMGVSVGAAADRGVLRYPLAFHGDGKTNQHEVVGAAHGTERPYAKSGPLDIGSGGTVYVKRLIPDEKTQGDLRVELFFRRFPNSGEVQRGPYSLRRPTSLRGNARQVSVKIKEAKTGDWRWGTPQIEVAKGGMR